MSQATKSPSTWTNLRELPANVWNSLFRNPLPGNDLERASTSFTNFFLHIHPVRVKKSAIRVSYTLCLGGLSFFLFIVLTISGLFLMFYYIPSVDQAYQNIKDLQFVATFNGDAWQHVGAMLSRMMDRADAFCKFTPDHTNRG